MATELLPMFARGADANNATLSGAKWYFYATGTTTPQASYADSEKATPHANPVVADAGGKFAPIYLDAELVYRGVLKSSDGSLTIFDVDPINTTTLAALLADDGATNLAFKQSGSGTTRRTAAARFAEQFALTDFTGVASAGADETAEIIAGLAANSRTFLIAPYGTKFDRPTLLASASVPVGRVILDLSGINDWNQSGSTETKSFGILSKDTGPNDTHWYVGSDHHPILNLNNYGTSGSTSGDERKASLLWSVGELSGANEGFRGAAIQQFTKDSGSDYWLWQIRSLAPWKAITNDFEFWTAGEDITAAGGAGVYRFTGDNHYRSESGGITGATMPTHTTGVDSDGGVDWLWVGSADRSIISIREDGRMLIGNGTFDATFRHAVSVEDPGAGGYTGELAARAASADVLWRFKPTNSSSDEVAVPALKGSATLGLQVTMADYTTTIIRFTDASGMIVSHTTLENTAASGTSISVTGKRKLTVTNGGATNLDTLSGGVDNQELLLIFGDGNTTVRNMIGNINLTGSANQLFTQHSALQLHRISGSDRWVEVSRSVK